MLCSCGRPVLLAESDADKKAIDDLKRQVKGQSGIAAELTKARIEQLQAEVDAEKAYQAAIRRANASMIQSMANHATMRAILGYTDEQLMEFILQGGLGLAVDEFIEQTDLIRQSVQKGILAIKQDINFSQIASDLEAIQAITAKTVFEDVILPPVKKSITESLRDGLLEVPTEIIVSNLQTRLESSIGRQLTEIKTQISSYGRSITAFVAESAGLDLYLYTGPKDGITRPFCNELINLVVTKDQMNKLNNGQGLGVLVYGGGYNCRHSWSPVTQGFVEAAGLPLATNANINEANDKAKR